MSNEVLKRRIINDVMRLLRNGQIRTSTPNDDILAMIKVPDNECDEINWMAYRSEVAKIVLPPILSRTWVEHDIRSLRSADDVAIDNTIDIAIKIAERLEKRLKRGKYE